VFASEIKRTYSPTDASYVEAERSYLAARSRYLAYVEAVKLAVESNEKADLTKVTEEVEQASAEFLRSSSRGLQSGTEPRELPVDAASKLSRSVHTHLSKVPEQHRDMVLQALDETQWRSWREI
jgi:hypothetical protein